jgi:hypothetical protein
VGAEGVERITEKGNLLTADGRRVAQPGNTLALSHGGWSDRIVNPLARELVAHAQGLVEYLRDPSYDVAVWAWARTEARVLVVSAWLDEHGTIDENGTPRPAAAQLLQWENLASKQRQRLGLDPLSRAALGRDVAASKLDLARLYEQLDKDD